MAARYEMADQLGITLHGHPRISHGRWLRSCLQHCATRPRQAKRLRFPAGGRGRLISMAAASTRCWPADFRCRGGCYGSLAGIRPRDRAAAGFTAVPRGLAAAASPAIAGALFAGGSRGLAARHLWRPKGSLTICRSCNSSVTCDRRRTSASRPRRTREPWPGLRLGAAVARFCRWQGVALMT